MQTRTNDQIGFSDITAVKEFLLFGREIPTSVRPGKPSVRRLVAVPVHQGIVRVRGRSAVKA